MACWGAGRGQKDGPGHVSVCPGLWRWRARRVVVQSGATTIRHQKSHQDGSCGQVESRPASPCSCRPGAASYQDEANPPRALEPPEQPDDHITGRRPGARLANECMWRATCCLGRRAGADFKHYGPGCGVLARGILVGRRRGLLAMGTGPVVYRGETQARVAWRKGAESALQGPGRLFRGSVVVSGLYRGSVGLELGGGGLG